MLQIRHSLCNTNQNIQIQTIDWVNELITPLINLMNILNLEKS